MREMLSYAISLGFQQYMHVSPVFNVISKEFEIGFIRFHRVSTNFNGFTYKKYTFCLVLNLKLD